MISAQHPVFVTIFVWRHPNIVFGEDDKLASMLRAIMSRKNLAYVYVALSAAHGFTGGFALLPHLYLLFLAVSAVGSLAPL